MEVLNEALVVCNWGRHDYIRTDDSYKNRLFNKQERSKRAVCLPAPNMEFAIFATELSIPPPEIRFAESSSKSISSAGEVADAPIARNGVPLAGFLRAASANPTKSGIRVSLRPVLEASS